MPSAATALNCNNPRSLYPRTGVLLDGEQNLSSPDAARGSEALRCRQVPGPPAIHRRPRRVGAYYLVVFKQQRRCYGGGDEYCRIKHSSAQASGGLETENRQTAGRTGLFSRRFRADGTKGKTARRCVRRRSRPDGCGAAQALGENQGRKGQVSCGGVLRVPR